MSSPDWDNVPVMTDDGRTLPLYPDPHPEFTAEVWRKLKLEQEERRLAAMPKDGGDAIYAGYEAPIITQAAEEFDEPCRSLAGFVKLATASGWDLVELAHALSFSKGKPYEGGQKAGTMREDRNVDLQWAKFEKPGVGRALIAFPIVNGKTDGPRVVRSFNGVARSDAEMKKILKGEV